MKLSADSISRCWFLAALDQRLVALALLRLEVVVVAGVEVDHAPVELHDVGDHAVEEVAVVADDHQRARPAQGGTPPATEALEVQVVGGLVQQQQVGLLEQQPGQGHAHAPASGELDDGPSKSLSRKPMPRRMVCARASSS